MQFTIKRIILQFIFKLLVKKKNFKFIPSISWNWLSIKKINFDVNYPLNRFPVLFFVISWYRTREGEGSLAHYCPLPLVHRLLKKYNTTVDGLPPSLSPHQPYQSTVQFTANNNNNGNGNKTTAIRRKNDSTRYLQ